MNKAALKGWYTNALATAATSGADRRCNWTGTEKVVVARAAHTFEAVSALVQKSAARDLQDFDNYLDNVQNDWRNQQLNRDLPQLLAMY